jgi:hypothetical protein
MWATHGCPRNVLCAFLLQTLGEAERRKVERIEELAAKEQADKRSADLRSVIEGRVNKVRGGRVTSSRIRVTCSLPSIWRVLTANHGLVSEQDPDTAVADPAHVVQSA